jgi:hypothetical protein
MKTSGFHERSASGKRIPAIPQAVYPQPARVLNQKFMTLDFA